MIPGCELIFLHAKLPDSTLLSSDTYFFHHINNNPLSHSSFSHPSPPLQTHMKCGWMGNYYVVNITHPTACSFNEIDTKPSDEYVGGKATDCEDMPKLTPNQHRNLFSLSIHASTISSTQFRVFSQMRPDFPHSSFAFTVLTAKINFCVCLLLMFSHERSFSSWKSTINSVGTVQSTLSW